MKNASQNSTKKARSHHPIALGYDESTITWYKLFALFEPFQKSKNAGDFYVKVFPDSLREVFPLIQSPQAEADSKLRHEERHYKLGSSTSRVHKAIEDASGPFSKAIEKLVSNQNQAGEVDPLGDFCKRWRFLIQSLSHQQQVVLHEKLRGLLDALLVRMEMFCANPKTIEVDSDEIKDDETIQQLDNLNEQLGENLVNVAVMQKNFDKLRSQLDNSELNSLIDVLAVLSVIASTLFTSSGYIWYEIPVVKLKVRSQSELHDELKAIEKKLRIQDTSDNAKKLRSLIFPEENVSANLKKVREAIEKNAKMEDDTWRRLNKLLMIPLADKQLNAEASFLAFQIFEMRISYLKNGDPAGDTVELHDKADRYLEVASNAELPAAQKEKGKRLLFAVVEAMKTPDFDRWNAIKKLNQIRSLQYCDDLIKGKAILELCAIISDKRTEKTLCAGYNVDSLLKQSMELGCEEAGKLWQEKHPNNRPRIAAIFDPSPEETVRWYINAENGEAIQIFRKSLGESEDQRLYSSIPPKLSAEILKEGRFLFISDDSQKNLRDALEFLQKLQDRKLDVSLVPQVYVRNDSDIAAAAIDTALNHLPGLCDVRIINDAKNAAQQLLTKHPLFYQLPRNAFDQHRPKLNFVILGTDDVAEWLCREAFWMLGFRDNAVTCRITIVAPDAVSFATRIKTRNPGMAKGITITGISLAEIVAEETSYDQADFMRIISRLRGEDDTYLYFAVAAGNDEENLALARWIRIGLIRSAIRNRNNTLLNAKEPIAVYCRDTHLSTLSKNMVIESEAYGNSWFNNWALIPFGALSATYTWNSIGNDVMETMAKCVHLEYCGVDPELRNTELQKAVNVALESYYRRQYNRESSYSIALGMPYRMFQFKRDAIGKMVKWQYDNNLIQIENVNDRLKVTNADSDYFTLIPQGWDVLDPNAWMTKAAWQYIGSRFPKAITDYPEIALQQIKRRYTKRKKDNEESSVEEMAQGEAYSKLDDAPKHWINELIAVSEWEHARWTRWMLSRGWMPASPEEAIFAYRAGNKRQQLFVALLHPCICSFSDLIKLAEHLHEKISLNKDFIKYDVMNVSDTKKILEMQWFRESNEEKKTEGVAAKNE